MKPEGPTETNWGMSEKWNGSDGEGGRYHARSSGFAREFLGHEAVDES